MLNTTPYRIAVAVLLALVVLVSRALAADEVSWPKKVLITNDNGISDIKIQELAKSFSKIAETVVVAAREDKSGTTNFMQSLQTGRLTVTRQDLGRNIG